MKYVDLDSATVLMSGALSATAQAILMCASEAGASFVLSDVVEPAAAAAKLQSWGLSSDRYIYLQADLLVESSVRTMVSEAFRLRPDISTVLGHAGGCTLHPFSETDSVSFARIFDLNFTGQTFLTRAVTEEWLTIGRAGHVIFTSSYVATVPHSRISAYTCAKAALEMFARCMALEFSPARIRFNAISPGNIAVGSSLAVYETDAEYRAFVDRVSPWGERNSASGIADALLFLMSPLAREMNGTVLHVDMGVGIPKIG